MPTPDNIAHHHFIHSERYAVRDGIWDRWLEASSQGVRRQIDHMLSYVMMVRAGNGIGLLANFMTGVTTATPVDLGIHIPAPITIVVNAERLNTAAVRVVFEWLSLLLGPENRLLHEGSEQSTPATPYADYLGFFKFDDDLTR